MAVTASKLREDIYNLLDTVIDTGEPVEVLRKGRILRIIAVESPASRIGRIAKLRESAAARSNVILCDPSELVEIDWSGEWKPEL